MPHASNIVYCDGPDSAHAFDIVPVLPRNDMGKVVKARLPR